MSAGRGIAPSNYSSGTRPSSESDFSDTLNHAEALLSLWESDSDRLRLLRALIGGLAFGTLAALALAVAAMSLALGGSAPKATLVLTAGILLGIAVAFAFVVLSLWTRLILPLTRRLQRDEHAIAELLGMLREVLPLVRDDPDMSFVRYQTFKTRLSRFPVTPGRHG